MTIELPPLNPDDPAHYRICAQGSFNPRWLDMLSGDWVIVDDSLYQTEAITLVGQVLDQAALLGVLLHLYDIGLPLLSVEYLAHYTSKPP